MEGQEQGRWFEGDKDSPKEAIVNLSILSDTTSGSSTVTESSPNEPTLPIDPQNADIFVGMSSAHKATLHDRLRGRHHMTQPYLDAAYDIVLDFRVCHSRVMQVDVPEMGEPGYDDVPDKVKAGTIFDVSVGFPPKKYSEDSCVNYLEEFGPKDIAGGFSRVKQLSLSSTVPSTFKYMMYFAMMNDFKPFLVKWLTLDHIQFYHCWVSRSIGSFPNNIFLFPTDYYQEAVQKSIKDDASTQMIAHDMKQFMRRMWKYVHPASFHRHEVNTYKLKKGRKKTVQSDACIVPCKFDIFQKKEKFYAFV